jgi:hypothetical protein
MRYCLLCGHPGHDHHVTKDSRLTGPGGAWDVLSCPRCPDGLCRAPD